MERLSKVLAHAGVASRRKSEELIQNGLVTVNGQVVTLLGFKVSQKDEILVNGKPIDKATLVYFLMNKPTGYLSTSADALKRRNITDLLLPEDKDYRLYPIHKLEYDAAGLLIITNDGDLTKHLTQPNIELKMEYNVRLKGIMIREKLRELRRGVLLGKKTIDFIDIAIFELDKKNQSTLVRFVCKDVTSKELREVFEKIGHPIKNMTRIGFDTLNLEGVARGGYRRLKVQEVKYLFRDLSTNTK